MCERYDHKDKYSIYKYAKDMIGKSFNQICDEEEIYFEREISDTADRSDRSAYADAQRKGGLGDIIEDRYFHITPGNDAGPDFPEAELELKVTPYKINKNKSLSAKERLIISLINYMSIVDADFYTSNAWEKIKNILLVWYLWSSEIENRLDYIISYVFLYSPSSEDLQIIKNDYQKIRQKVIDGKAHELSEGDTLYLGAATKASDSRRRTAQPFSTIPARPRAFSFKNSYMTYVLRNYVVPTHEKVDKIIRQPDFGEFEQYILDKINAHVGKRDVDLFVEYFSKEKPNEKHKHSRLAFEILGVKTKNAEEFEKANIVVKSVRVESLDRIIESVSFPAFKISELVKENWEDSSINQFFNETRFFFIIFERKGNDYYLAGAKFWNMPMKDIEGDLRTEWERARDTFREGVKFSTNDISSPVKNNLPKKSNTRILHVRPHATRSAYLINGIKYGNGKLDRDADLLPDGNRMTKQCFWLNNDYVLRQIADIIE